MQPDIIIKPVFAPAVIKPTVQIALVLMLCIAAATDFSSNAEISSNILPLIMVALLFISVGLTLLTQWVRFNKTSYSFYPDRIVLKTGGIFDDRSVELQLKNITHVSATIPYFEHQLFQTGNVYIEAAGGSGTEISMTSIENPMALYKEVAARMQNNGFSLTRKQKIQHEQPGIFGTIIQMGEGLATVAFALIYLVISSLSQLLTDDKALADNVQSGASSLFSDFSPLLFLSLGTLALITLAAAVLYALDLSRRNYILYDDVIDYADGFLTQRHKFIPLENLADVTLTQTLVRRIFNYSDLLVSSQGANTNIPFKVMPRADLFKANLERLIRAHKAQPPAANFNTPAAQFGADGHFAHPNDWSETQSPGYPPHAIHPHAPLAAPLHRRATNRPDLALRLSLTRAIGGTAILYGSITFAAILLAFIAYPIITGLHPDSGDFIQEFPRSELTIGIVVLMGILAARDTFNHAVAFYATHYRVDDHKIGLHHTLFNKKHVEFTLDKITSVAVSHGLADRIFDTTTIKFHSIGTSEVITFKHLDDGPNIATDILERLGFDDTHPTRVLTPQFNAHNVLRAHIPAVAGLVLWTLVSFVVAIYFPIFLIQLLLVFGLLLGQYAISETYYKRARLEIFDNRLRLRTGIFTISSHYAAIHDIKHIHSTQYPDSKAGTLRWTIAGGDVQTLPYIDDITTQHEQLDALLYTQPIKPVRQTPQFTTQTLQTAQPALGNSITLLVAGSIVIFPLIPLLPLTLTALVIYLRNTHYTAETSRITHTRGRLYRQRQTILYNRIDHLTTTHAALNKLFKNGTIGIATVGSTDVDLTLKDFPEFLTFYDTIKQNLPSER